MVPASVRISEIGRLKSALCRQRPDGRGGTNGGNGSTAACRHRSSASPDARLPTVRDRGGGVRGGCRFGGGGTRGGSFSGGFRGGDFGGRTILGDSGFGGIGGMSDGMPGECARISHLCILLLLRLLSSLRSLRAQFLQARINFSLSNTSYNRKGFHLGASWS
jgi:hypothetical protein